MMSTADGRENGDGDVASDAPQESHGADAAPEAPSGPTRAGPDFTYSPHGLNQPPPPGPAGRPASQHHAWNGNRTQMWSNQPPSPPPGSGGQPPPGWAPAMGIRAAPEQRTRAWSGSMWLALALVVVVTAATALYAVLALRDPSPDPVIIDPSPTTESAPPTPSATSPSTPSSPASAPPASAETLVVPHGNGGEFLSAAYAQGAKEHRIEGENRVELVGASADASVVAVKVDYEVRGIDSTTTETLWTYPSYSCSTGSWDGVVLCIDDADPGVVYGDEIPDIVGVDLATGDVAFRFTPAGMPGYMQFIGSDDEHAFFTLTIRGSEGRLTDAQPGVLALDAGGAVAWLTLLDTDEAIWQAAMADGGTVAINLEDSVVLLERGTGAIALEHPVGEEEGFLMVDLLWDGWLAYMDDDALPYWVFDHSGDLVGKFSYIDEFIPSSRTVSSTVVPVYSAEAITAGGRDRWERWAVSQEGERVVGEVGGRIVDAQGNHLATEFLFLEGLSADGSLFLSNRDTRSIHDARSGEVVGGFSPSESSGYASLLDGIVFQEMVVSGTSALLILLPGPG